MHKGLLSISKVLCMRVCVRVRMCVACACKGGILKLSTRSQLRPTMFPKDLVPSFGSEIEAVDGFKEVGSSTLECDQNTLR